MAVKHKIRRWGPVALLLALTALVFALGLGRKQKTWINMTEGLLAFEQGTTRSVNCSS